MKIVSFFESIKIGGGVEKVQANLSKGLVDLGYDFTHLILEDKIPRNEYKGKIVSLNEKFIFGFGLKKIILLFKLGYIVSKYCRKEKVDIILGQGDFFYMIVAISKLLFGNKSKCIGVIHTTIGIWSKFIISILIFLLKRLDKVVLISNEELNTFVKEYGFRKCSLELIYNGVDLLEIEKKLSENLEKKYEYLFLNDKFTFINVGRLTHQKNHKLLLEAFDEFHNNNLNSQLIILGDGELKDELLSFKDTLVSKYDIHFLGNQENIFPFFAKSNCFILSSKFEGFGLVLVEAMASGLPIISTNCHSGPVEILQGNINSEIEITKNAILVPNQNKIALSEGLKEMYINDILRQEISRNNLKRVKDFSYINMLDKWKYLIDNL